MLPYVYVGDVGKIETHDTDIISAKANPLESTKIKVWLLKRNNNEAPIVHSSNLDLTTEPKIHASVWYRTTAVGIQPKLSKNGLAAMFQLSPTVWWLDKELH